MFRLVGALLVGAAVRLKQPGRGDFLLESVQGGEVRGRYSLLGLEATTRGRACFRSALKRCAGACCGKESVEDHHARLLGGLAAISVKCWPWEGAVALKEVGETMTQYHIVHNWFWLGAVDNLQEAATLLRTPAGFDHDGYKILCKPVLTGEFDVIVLNDQAAS